MARSLYSPVIPELTDTATLRSMYAKSHADTFESVTDTCSYVVDIRTVVTLGDGSAMTRFAPMLRIQTHREGHGPTVYRVLGFLPGVECEADAFGRWDPTGMTATSLPSLVLNVLRDRTKRVLRHADAHMWGA